MPLTARIRANYTCMKDIIWIYEGITIELKCCRQNHSMENQSLIARFMGPTGGPPGSCRPQVGPMLAPWTLLSGIASGCDLHCHWSYDLWIMLKHSTVMVLISSYFVEVLVKISPKNLLLNTLRPRQNGRLFADDTFKRIFLNETNRISIKISLKFVPKGLINNIPALVLIMAWRRPGDKPLSEPMMVRSLTHICVTRPQWVKM